MKDGSGDEAQRGAPRETIAANGVGCGEERQREEHGEGWYPEGPHPIGADVQRHEEHHLRDARCDAPLDQLSDSGHEEAGRRSPRRRRPPHASLAAHDAQTGARADGTGRTSARVTGHGATIRPNGRR